MRIRHPGKIRKGLWFLGREESGVYLLEGDHGSMIISGGMSYIVPDVLRQFEEFGIDPGRIKKILILHSHFDHVGIVPFLKRRYPMIEVYGSQRGWEILQMEKAIATINEFSRAASKRMGMEKVFSTYDLEWRKEITGKKIKEGDKIDLGGLEVSIFEIPGHSSCCIAAYVADWKALFPSDGGGIPFKEIILPSGNSNYTNFQQSLEKLNGLEVEYFCADHYGYIVGEEAKYFICQTIEIARQQRLLMEEAYRRHRDIEATAKELISSFYEEHPDYLLPPEILFGVYCQMIRHIASASEGNV